MTLVLFVPGEGIAALFGISFLGTHSQRALVSILDVAGVGPGMAVVP